MIELVNKVDLFIIIESPSMKTLTSLTNQPIDLLSHQLLELLSLEFFFVAARKEGRRKKSITQCDCPAIR